jgi:predicted O-methyltransferase YrrM
MDILEVGSYEGLSSVFFADNLLDHKDSTLTCVDPFMSIETNDHEEFFANNEELNFDYNIKNCKNSDKIKVEKITSDVFFKTNSKIFNFIYIDGCHLCDFITRDMENSFSVLEVNGIMWMDDYLNTSQGVDVIKNVMDLFLQKYEGQYSIIHSGWQLAIKKIY